MSLITLLAEKRTALAPPPNQETYEEFVFQMEKNGTNDLVERDMVDPTFRPPLTEDTYIAKLFREGAISNKLI